MRDMAKRWLYALITGYALVFYSELLFWGTGSLSAFLETWLFYSTVTYVFLAVVAHFRVNTLWSLFLAGALYGWLTEGVLVATVYENLPANISLTGLSWHALITIWVGWYAMRRAVLAARPARALFWSVGIGLFAGLWLPFWGFDTSAGITPFTPTSLALLMGAAVPLLAVSYGLQSRWTPRPFTPHKIEIGLLTGFFLLLFALGVLPAYPIAAVVLPFLLLVIYLGLRRHRRNGPPESSFIERLAGPVRPLNLLSMLAIIPAALMAFALSEALHLTPYPQYLIYFVTAIGGFLALAVSLDKIRRERADPPSRVVS